MWITYAFIPIDVTGYGEHLQKADGKTLATAPSVSDIL
jgi:hypothetical protein